MSVRFRRPLLLAAGAVAATVVAVPVVVNTASAQDDSAAQPRIVGGTQASLADHPYAVFLEDQGGNQFCGGVIIGDSAVATAAHCAVAIPKQNIRVVAGRQDKRTKDGVELPVSQVWVQKSFSDPIKGDDVAVLNVRGSLPYKAAKLPDASDTDLYNPGTQAVVLGWGRVADGGARSDYLRSATVPMVSDKDCKADYDSYDASSMVCAGYQQGGIDACQGDSGGPLMEGDTLVGLVSYGDGCAKAGKPGVYTRVAAFSDEMAQEAQPRLFG